jgi:cytochrome P450
MTATLRPETERARRPRALPAGPRNRFPGDLLWSLRGDTLNFLTRVARQYGDFVPFTPWRWQYVLVNDPETIRDVLVTRAEQFMKGPALRRSKQTLGEGLLTSEGEFHRRQRRLSQPALHPQRVAAYAEAMTAISLRTDADWRDGAPIDAHEQMMRLTLRVVAKTLFDADVEAEVDAIGHAMDVSVNMFTRTMTPWGPLLNYLPLPSNFRFWSARKLLYGTVERFIAERRAAGADVAHRGDLLSILVRAQDAGEKDEGGRMKDEGQSLTASIHPSSFIPHPSPTGMTDKQLRNESLTMFTAGHETTANALTFAWYLLARHPEAEARFHAEIDSVLAGRTPTVADLEALPYTRAVVSESMRLYPPAWAVARQAKADVEVASSAGPRLLAKDAVVLMSQWVTHRDPRWWPEPDRFDPGRWLPEASEAAARRPRYAHYPFGGGPRSCIGEAFAWTEAMLVLATLARRWSLRLVRPDQPLDLVPTITLRPRNGLPMVPVARRGAR